MRALFAAAVAGFALAACGQADQLPPGMASRIVSPAGVFSVAVPAEWVDLGRHATQEATGPTGPHTWSLGLPGRVGFEVVWVDDLIPAGLSLTEVARAPVTIAGDSVPTQSDGMSSLVAHFQHQVAGRREQFFASCPYEVPRESCVAILNTWRWEASSGGRTLAVVIGAVAGTVLAAAAVVIAVLARRRRKAPS